MYDIVSKTYDVVTSKRYDVEYLRHRMVSRTRCRFIQDDDVVYIVHDVISIYFFYVRHRDLRHDVVSSDTMSCPKNTMSGVYDVATLRRRVFFIRHRNFFLADIEYDIEFFIRRRHLRPKSCKSPYVFLPLVDQPKSRCLR